MRRNRRTRVLAIDPGTRKMGVAVLDRGELVYHAVLTIQNRTSPHDTLRECRSKVLRLLDDFRPALVAVEKPFFAQNRNTALLNVLFDEIRAIARRRSIRFLSFAPSTIKKAIGGNGRASKDQVALAVVARYPELKIYLGQDRPWKTRHHANRFDAVALALLVDSQL